MTDVKLSEHFWLSEFLASETAARHGIANDPDDAILEALRYNAGQMEFVRSLLGGAVRVLSGFRCLALNRLLGSPDGSGHVLGLATDFICPAFGTPIAICRAIEASQLVFDQLIYEHTWVHIAWPPLGKTARRDVLTLLAGGGYGRGIMEA